MTTPPPGPWVEQWLSQPRFAVYLRAAGHDRQRALAYYEWNAEVSAAFHHDLAHLEIALRNAYDRALLASTGPGEYHWIFQARRYFPPQWHTAANGVRYDANKTARKNLDEAITKATAGGTTPGPGKVIAELSFGFWRYLSVKRHHDSLWVPYLHRAFRSRVSRRTVDTPVGRLHSLRNRVAHHEPLLALNLTERHTDLLTVAGLISPELRDYIASHSTLPRLLSTTG